MDISNPQYREEILCTGGERLRPTLQNIGVWDMQTNQTKAVAHGLTAANIRLVQAVIINDADTARRYLNNSNNPVAPVKDGWVDYWDATNVNLVRADGGAFNSPGYNDGVMNRGFLIIWSIVP